MRGNWKHTSLQIVSFVGLWALGLIFFALTQANHATAQETGKTIKYPSKPIRIIVPAASTGGLGQEIRMIAPFLEKSLGVKTIIEYVPGAAGMIAYNRFYEEKPDGYTIMHYNISSPIALELTRNNAKFVMKNTSPIATWNIKNHLLTVHPDSWKTFSEFVDEAKKKNLSFAIMGGSATLQGLLIENALGVKFNWVPYAGAAEPLAAVAGKHVEACLSFTMSPKPLIQAGKLRALAVFSSKRDQILPKVPIPKELGHSEIPLFSVYGMMAAPPNTPREIVAVLEKAVQKVTANPEFNKLADTSGLAIDFQSSQEINKLTVDYYEVINKYKQFLKD